MGCCHFWYFTISRKWLKLLTIEKPDCFITAEKVTKGKPHPQGYQAARDTLGYHDAHYKVAVFEDAPAGITAGKGAGAIVIGICSTYEPEKVRKSGANIVVKDLSSFKIESYNKETDEFKVVVGEYFYADDEFLQSSA